jgi:hypothetical protein
VDRGALGTQRQAHSAGVAVKLYGATIGASGLDDDIAAALAAADSPSGSNPFVTGVRHTLVHLSSADILSLATPKTAIDVGAGQVPVIFGWIAVFTPGGTPYTPAEFSNLNLGMPGFGPTSILLEGLIDQTVKTSVVPAAIGSSVAQPLGGAIGTDWVLYSEDNPTLGNGTLDIEIWYALVDTA